MVSLRSNGAGLFARGVQAIAVGQGEPERAKAYALTHFRDTPEIAAVLKDAMSSLSTVDSAPILLPGTTAFLELVRPRTIIGKLLRLRRVPFTNGLAVAISSAKFVWVSQGHAVPVGRLAFAGPVSLPSAKIGGLVVITDELSKQTSPAVEGLINTELANGLTEFLDTAFVDATFTATSDSPGSITSEATGIGSVGNDAAAAIEDLHKLITTAYNQTKTLDGWVIVMSDLNAFALATFGNGAPFFPNLRVDGGDIYGIPVVTSAAAGTQLIAVHAPSVLIADDGVLNVNVARHATIEMDSAPSHDSVTPTPADLVSMWQTNSAAIMLTRWINWKLSRSDAAQVVTGAEYLPVGIES